MSIGRHDKKFFSILLATSFVLAASLLPAAFDGAGPQAFAQDKGSKDKLTAKEIVDRMVDKNNAKAGARPAGNRGARARGASLPPPRCAKAGRTAGAR